MRRGKHQHPILTWGNGSASLSGNYTFFLKHMASWGFVIIAAQDKNSGVGQTILDGANFLTAANSNPVSIFFHKLNVSQVGSFGHSQGATGAINALIKSAGMIKTVLPIELPGQQFCASPLNCTDTSHLTQGSIFLVDGSLDIPISPPTQPASATGLQSIAAYYSAVRVGVIKVKGTPIGPTHCDVQGVPTCTPTTVPCFLGVYGYLGYPTAWMMFQLQNDNLTGGAFVNGTGEIFFETTNWQLVTSNVPLPHLLEFTSPQPSLWAFLSSQLYNGRSWSRGSAFRSRSFDGAEFPEDLAEDAEGEFGIGGGEVEAADEAADLFLGGGGGATFLRTAGIRFHIAAGAEGVEQKRGEALEIGGGGEDRFGRMRGRLGIACEFVEAHGYSLAEVHGAMFLARGDAQEPVAVAEVFIRKTPLL